MKTGKTTQNNSKNNHYNESDLTLFPDSFHLDLLIFSFNNLCLFTGFLLFLSHSAIDIFVIVFAASDSGNKTTGNNI